MTADEIPTVDAIVDVEPGARILLNGKDVSSQCVEVWFAGERAVGVLLEKYRDGQTITVDGKPVYILLTGQITVEGLSLSPTEPSASC